MGGGCLREVVAYERWSHMDVRLYSNSSNSTIMNKKKQVSHSKQETISIIFTHPSLPEKNIV